MGMERRMIHKSHDEVFQELCKEFPGLMEYLLDGHLAEVGKLTEKVRDLGNALASADARYADRNTEANFLAVVNKRHEDLIRRIGMMLDREQLHEPDRTDHDLVSCALPMSVALDLVAAARPLIVAKGEQELMLDNGEDKANLNGDVFRRSSFSPKPSAQYLIDAQVKKSGMQYLIGEQRALIGMEYTKAVESFAKEYQGTLSFEMERNPSTAQWELQEALIKVADSLLLRNDWCCVGIDMCKRYVAGTMDVVIRTAEGPRAAPIDCDRFRKDFRAAAKSHLPIGVTIDEVTLVGTGTNQVQRLLPTDYALAAGSPTYCSRKGWR